ncbi:MAG: hypothetical protein M1330_02895 [Armatimonadetes bacterium]|nr:hypothetical protein [Armatimonadota bacterium]
MAKSARNGALRIHVTSQSSCDQVETTNTSASRVERLEETLDRRINGAIEDIRSEIIRRVFENSDSSPSGNTTDPNS